MATQITLLKAESITQVTSDLEASVQVQVDQVAADAAQAAADRAYLESQVTPLYALASPSLPLGPIAIPAGFSNHLGVSISWNGTAVQFAANPYDIIDFTNSETCNHYYVNWAEGDNANAGTSTGVGNSWKTLDYAFANAVSPAVVHFEDEWIGSASSNNTNKVFSGKIKLIGEGPNGRSRIQSFRESDNLAAFAWAASGASGAYESTTVSGQRIYRSMFDANYLDVNGIPLPITAAADKATAQATRGTFFSDATELVVHMPDGRIPDPADGWIANNAEADFELQQSLSTSAGVMLMENMDVTTNLGDLAKAVIRYRPVTTGAANTARVGFRNVRTYGGSGNGFELYDGGATAVDSCVAAFNRIDNFNYHSFVTTGTKGEFINAYETNCISYSAGYDNWAGQPTRSTSSNGSTAHDSLQIMRANCQHFDGYGAVIADVNGVMSLNFNVAAGTPGGVVLYNSCFWHEKYVGAGTYKLMYLWGCSAHDGGDASVKLLDNTAQAGGTAQDGEIRLKYWRGQTDGAVIGPVYDFNGTVVT